MGNIERIGAGMSLLLLAGCGGGGGGSSTSTPNQDVGGLWTAEYTVSSGADAGDTVNSLSLISETGQYFQIGQNPTTGCATLVFGQISASGANVTGTGNFVLLPYTTVSGTTPTCQNPDGTDGGTSSISGTLAQQSGATLTTTFTTSAGASEPSATLTDSFSSLYLTPSALTTIAGNYTDGSATMNISASGVILEQDANGCEVNGQMSVLDSSYNLYGMQITFSGCPSDSSEAVLNGLTFSGLVTLDTQASPVALVGALSSTYEGHAIATFVGLPQT